MKEIFKNKYSPIIQKQLELKSLSILEYSSKESQEEYPNSTQAASDARIETG